MRSHRPLERGQAEFAEPFPREKLHQKERRLSPSSGQAEFAVLIAIFIIAVVIAAIALSGTSPSSPASLSPAQRQLRALVEREAAAAAGEALRALESTGGALASTGGPAYRGNLVRSWQACSETAIPDLDRDIEPRLAAAVAALLKDRLPTAVSTLEKQPTFDLSQLRASANLVDGKADLTLTLPALLGDQPVDPLYAISVPTDYKQLHAFASDLSTELSQKRTFEYFTIASLYLSSLPTKGVLAGCGKSITIPPATLSDHLQAVASFVLANTYWWQSFPAVGPGDPKAYAFPTVNGNSYPFTPTLSFPDDFRLQSLAPIIITNTEELIPSFALFRVPECIAVYDQKYSLDYPIVFSLQDAATGGTFSFSTRVSVKDMEPNPSCDLQPIARTDPCAGACTVRATALTPAGTPIPDVSVLFGSCALGATGADGSVESTVPCGPGELSFFPADPTLEFSELPATAPPDAPLDITATLWRKPVLDTSFLMASIKRRCYPTDTVSQDCMKTDPLLPSADPVPILGDYTICTLKPNSDSDNRFTLSSVASLRTEATSPITNLNPLPAAPLDTEPGRNACLRDPASCFGNARDRISIDYLPSGPATFNTELRLIGLQSLPQDVEDLDTVPRWVQGATRTTVSIPEQDTPMTITVPIAAERSLDEYRQDVTPAGRDFEARRAASRCDLPAISFSPPPTHRYVIKHREEAADSCFPCTEARTVLSLPPFSIGEARLNDLFAPRCNLVTTGTDANGLPIQETVCTHTCDPAAVAAFAESLNARMDPICA